MQEKIDLSRKQRRALKRAKKGLRGELVLSEGEIFLLRKIITVYQRARNIHAVANDDWYLDVYKESKRVDQAEVDKLQAKLQTFVDTLQAQEMALQSILKGPNMADAMDLGHNILGDC